MSAIPAHKTDDSALVVTPDNLPAVFSGPAEHVSKRYTHVNTSRFMEIAEKNGWVTFNAGMKKRRAPSIRKNPDSQLTAQHFLAFRPSDYWIASRGLIDKLRHDGGIGSISKMVPRLVIYNSHDCTTGLRAILGIFEFICSNSAIMCSDQWGKWSFRHTKLDSDKVYNNFFASVIESAPYLLDVRDEMEKIDVTENQALEFAEKVIDLRYDDGVYKVDPHQLLQVQYAEQADMNAYNVFNNVQRNLTQGGFYATKNVKVKHNPRRKQRAIKDFSKDLRINEGLWAKTNEWLGGMGYQLPPPPVINVDVR